jgi:hypothetical protein
MEKILLEKLTVPQPLKKFNNLMAPTGSLPYSQQLDTGPNP